MQFTHDNNQTTRPPQEERASRRRAFYIWQLSEDGKTFVELGSILGMTGPGVSKMLNQDRIPTKHHRKLVDAGVPAHLLPRAEDVLRGPKPAVLQ